MSYSIQRAVSDGTLKTLLLSIDFLDRSYIKVYVDNVEQPLGSAWTWATPKSITFAAPLPSGAAVAVRRSTDIAATRHSLSGGAQFTNATMDENFSQVLHITQETSEGLVFGDMFNDLNMHGNKVTENADGAAPGDLVTVRQYQADLNSAYASAHAAEAWANTPYGTPVAGAQYSAMHWAEQAKLNVAGVGSFNGRIGVVVPQAGDYSSTQLSDSASLMRTDGRVGTNKIINGKMEIAQRGTSFANTSNSYSLDRWTSVSTVSAMLAASQSTDVPAGGEFQSSLRLTVSTADASIAAGDAFLLLQYIEGYNARDLIGRTFTLSFWVRSSKTGTHCVAFRNSGTNRTYVAEYTISAANTWEKKAITVSGGLITSGTWDWATGSGVQVDFLLAAGSNFHTTADAWQTGSSLSTANQVNCLDTVGNIFAITGVQLEVGSVATPFEHRLYGQELALCRRYYRVTAFRHTASLYATGAFDSIAFPAGDMRVSPTVAWSLSETSNATSLGSVSGYQLAFNSVAAGPCIVGGLFIQSAEL